MVLTIFCDLLDRYDLKQRVTTTTRVSGHIIDFVIASMSNRPVKSTTVSKMITDHFAIHCV